MTSKEYETYVADLIRSLRFFRSGSIEQNRILDGVRQPGRYEIDISVELLLGGIASFLLIVECKNWQRPVDRPVIQKFAQTCDAVSAHKAAVVSPIGFTSQAVDVARARDRTMGDYPSEMVNCSIRRWDGSPSFLA